MPTTNKLYLRIPVTYAVCIDNEQTANGEYQGVFLDNSGRTDGSPMPEVRSVVSLIFKRATHEQIDELAATLRDFGPVEAVIEEI